MTLLAFLSGFSSSAYPLHVLVTASFACPLDEVVLSVWTVTGLFGLLPYTTRNRELLRKDLFKHQQSSDMLRRGKTTTTTVSLSVLCFSQKTTWIFIHQHRTPHMLLIHSVWKEVTHTYRCSHALTKIVVCLCVKTDTHSYTKIQCLHLCSSVASIRMSETVRYTCVHRCVHSSQTRPCLLYLIIFCPTISTLLPLQS